MPHQDTTPPNHTALFVQWLAACQANPFDPLSAQAAAPYASIWETWGRLLKKTPWHQARPLHVLKFINAAQSKHDGNGPTEITRRRYWRVLDRIYDYACTLGYTNNNPAQALPAKDTPAPEEATSTILSPRLFAVYHSYLPETAHQAHPIRNRAILMLLADCAPSPSEVVRMQVGDEIRNAAGQITAVTLTKKNLKTRVLSVTPETGAALQLWLDNRYLIASSTKTNDFFAGKPTFTTGALHTLVDQHISYAARVEGLPRPLRRGAQVIRNTVITHWLLEGVSVQECLSRAGLKTAGALYGLRHYLPAHIRNILNTSTSAEELETD